VQNGATAETSYATAVREKKKKSGGSKKHTKHTDQTQKKKKTTFSGQAGVPKKRAKDGDCPVC